MFSLGFGGECMGLFYRFWRGFARGLWGWGCGGGPLGWPRLGVLGGPWAAHEGLCPSALRAPAGMLQKPDKEMPRNFSTTEELRDIMRYYSKRGQAEMQENFYRAVYAAVRRIPAGKVATYGQIAMLAGSPRASRIVGGALHRNPEPGKTPCHRVVFRDGGLAPGFAFGGPGAQRALLEAEGVAFLPDGRVDMARHQWTGEDETQ